MKLLLRVPHQRENCERSEDDPAFTTEGLRENEPAQGAKIGTES